MSNITVSTDNYVELALGHARDINDKLGVGAKVKVLVGAAHAEARIDRLGYIHVPRRMVHQTSRTYTSLFPPEIRDRSPRPEKSPTTTPEISVWQASDWDSI